MASRDRQMPMGVLYYQRLTVISEDGIGHRISRDIDVTPNFKSIFNNVALSAPDLILKMYSGEIIEQVGPKNVTVDYNSKTKHLNTRIVKNDGL